jgi:hypothetical protein
MKKYFDLFEGVDSVREQFDPLPADSIFPTDEEVLIAIYTYEDYWGSAFVLFERDGKLYEVNGSHCSCYGLETQWEPEETSWPALRMRSMGTGSGWGDEFEAAWAALLAVPR